METGCTFVSHRLKFYFYYVIHIGVHVILEIQMHHYNGVSAMQLGSLWTCSAMHISTKNAHTVWD